MKKTVLALVAFVFMASLTVSGQSETDYLELSRSLLKLEKKAAIADAMDLSEEEAKAFWPLYEEYSGKLYLVQNQRIKLITDFAEKFETLSDEQADVLISDFLKYQGSIVKLKQQYFKKFKKILPAGKAARYMQAENKIETLIDASLAIELPLIETK